MRLLRSLTRRTLWIALFATLVGTVAFGWAMWRVVQALGPNTIFWMELAFTPANAAAILRSWGDAGRAAARQSLVLDVGFILLGYAPLLASACLLIGQRHEGRRRQAAEWLALGALVAGGFDLIENAALWGVIGSTAPAPSAVLTWTAGIAATIKFLLVLAAGAFVLVFGVLTWLARLTPLVQWVLTAPLLVLIAALVLGILWRVVLSAFGIPDLFWTEGAFLQVLAGIGVGPLLAHLGVLGFLLDTQRVSRLGEQGSAAWCDRLKVTWLLKRLARFPRLSGETPDLLASYLARTSVPLVVIAMASAVRAPGGVSPWWLPFGTLGGFVGYAALWLGLADVRLPAPAIVRNLARVGRFENLHSLGYAFLLLNAVIYAVLAFLYHGLGWGVSVGLTLCVLLGVLASIYGGLKYFFPGYVYAWLAAALVALVTLQSLGGHHLPHLDYYNRVPLERVFPQPEAAAAHDLAAWGASRAQAGAPKPPLVVVAVDGGGIRAAVWTTIVMSQLERDVPSFPYYVRVVTGASGGMVGIASYVASLQPPTAAMRHVDLDGNEVKPDQLVDRVAIDSLGTVARELVFKDFFLPPFLHRTSDRGLALERAWERSTRILGQPFANLAAGEAEGWRPSLIVSPLIVEDGRRLLISNQDVGDLVTVPGQSPSLQALEYFNRIERRPGTLRLSTAVRLNASFPYVSPAAELPTEPPRHVLDAGYYDEHGVELAGTWIWTHRRLILEHTNGVLLVQIPDKQARDRKGKAPRDRRDWWAAGLLGVTGPVQALLTSNSASADYRNDQLVRMLSESFNASQPGFFETVVFEPEQNEKIEELPGCGRSALRRVMGGKDPVFQDVALSWRLTSCEVSRLKESIRGGEASGICGDRRRFQDWWNTHKPGAEPTLAVKCPPASL